MTIKLIVGLGNPGVEYEQTRHNAGFWFVDQLAASFNNERGFHAHVAKTGACWLIKPQTFMNRSGLAVGTFARFYRIEPTQILVVHDELDLLPGVVKMKQGGSHAGHNGLRDIQAALGTQDFWRLRLGIGHPRALGLAQGVADFVLHNPNDEQFKAIEGAINHSLKIVPLLLQGEMERAAMQLHTDPNRVKPAKPEPKPAT